MVRFTTLVYGGGDTVCDSVHFVFSLTRGTLKLIVPYVGSD